MSRKQRASQGSDAGLIPGLDQLLRCPPDLAVAALARSGLPLHAELERQKAEGLVEQYGQVVIDGRLFVPEMLFAVPRTEAWLRLSRLGWIIDQGVSIPPGWIATKDRRIVKP